ncbi:MAG: hypothetical protein HeimC3_26560 [Candidatus Heimdallarchaeota archaeon LC_3]|nr:MAG: hypothetical protein HeimC3_26560 [Candidatus Heimdallarchaeota archaeon LC_3]
MDVNEEIVEKWLQLKRNQFTRTNIKFKVIGEKGGSNYSDIDILAVDNDGKYFDYEIKWRSKASLSATNQDKLNNIINQMTRPERMKKIEEMIGKSEYEKIFVTTKTFLGKSPQKREELTKIFKEKNIEMLFFEDIIKELVEIIDVKGSYDSMVLQIIRMLKYYDILK